MNQVLRISGAGTMALHALAVLAAKEDQWRSTRKLALRLGVSPHSLAVVLQLLQRQGIIRSVRGPRGGYMLAKDSHRISLLDIYQAVEGKFSPEECLLEKRVCPGKKCILGELLEITSRQFRDYLAKTKLSEVSFQAPD